MSSFSYTKLNSWASILKREPHRSEVLSPSLVSVHDLRVTVVIVPHSVIPAYDLSRVDREVSSSLEGSFVQRSRTWIVRFQNHRLPDEDRLYRT